MSSIPPGAGLERPEEPVELAGHDVMITDEGPQCLLVHDEMKVTARSI